MLGRSEEGIAKRSSKIQYKIRLPGKKKGTKKKKKAAKAAKAAQAQEDQSGDDSDRTGTPPPDENTAGALEPTEPSNSGEPVFYSFLLDTIFLEEMDFEEAITGTCPTIEEIFNAEETFVREDETLETGFASCYLSPETGPKNPSEALHGSNFGVFPTLAGPVFLTDQSPAVDSATQPSIREGHYALHNLNEIFQIVSV
jgi:hypothetical protein